MTYYNSGWIPNYTAGTNTWMADYTYDNIAVAGQRLYLQAVPVVPTAPAPAPPASLETEMEWLRRRVTEMCDLVPA